MIFHGGSLVWPEVHTPVYVAAWFGWQGRRQLVTALHINMHNCITLGLQLLVHKVGCVFQLAQFLFEFVPFGSEDSNTQSLYSRARSAVLVVLGGGGGGAGGARAE